jgi:hypothetical protein
MRGSCKNMESYGDAYEAPHDNYNIQDLRWLIV